jgi:hypothetical protein
MGKKFENALWATGVAFLITCAAVIVVAGMQMIQHDTAQMTARLVAQNCQVNK